MTDKRKAAERAEAETDAKDRARAEAEDEATEEALADPNQAGEASGGGEQDTESRIAALEAEIGELRDQLMRALAEVENTRRRAERDRQDAAKYGAVPLARDLLTVADNLRRALESVPEALRRDETGGGRNLVEGVELIERELTAAFARHGIAKVEPLGEPFDHALHQAMFELEDKDKPAGTVVQLLQPGYTLHDRLLRAAMVGVSKGGPKAPKNGGDAAQSETPAAGGGDTGQA